MKLWLAILGVLVALIGGGIAGWNLYRAPIREAEARAAQRAAEERLWRQQFLTRLRNVDIDAVRNFDAIAVPLLKNPQKLANAEVRAGSKSLFVETRDDLEIAIKHFNQETPFTSPDLVESHRTSGAYLVAWKRCYDDLIAALDQPKGPDRATIDNLTRQRKEIAERTVKMREDRHIVGTP